MTTKKELSDKAITLENELRKCLQELGQKGANKLNLQWSANSESSFGTSEKCTRILSVALDYVEDAIYLVDMDDKVVNANAQFYELTGLTSEQVLGKDINSIIHPEGEEVPCPVCLARKSRKDSLIAMEADDENNPTGKPIEVMIRMIRNSAGEPEMVLMAIRDLSHIYSMRQQLHLLSLDADIGAIIARDSNLQDMLQHCCEAMVKHLKVSFARIWTIGQDKGFLDLQASAGIYTHLNGPHKKIAVNSKTKIGYIAVSKKPHLTNTVVGDRLVTDQQWAKREGMVSFAGLPLMVDNTVIGVLGMFSRNRLHDMVLKTLITIADLISVGVQRKNHEFQIQTTTRALRTLSRCNEILVRAQSEEDFLQQSCRAIADEGNFALAWIGFAEHDHEKTIRPVASAGKGSEYVTEITVSWADNDYGKGPSGTAYRSGTPVTCDNLDTDPNFALWRKKAGKYGFSSSCSLPLSYGNTIFGTLNIYATSPGFFYGEELVLLQKLADDIAYGISYFRMEKEKNAAEQERFSAEKHLRQSQKMEALGVLAGGIAHDFNNILSAVLGFSELAETKLPRDEQAWRDIQEVIKAGKRARDLVSQILAFSRQGDPRQKPINTHIIVKETLKLLRASIPSNIAINQNLITSGDLINADPTQLHQIIMNLCINAYHAMRESGGTLSVSMERRTIPPYDPLLPKELLPGPYLILNVSDTGHGIPQAIIDRIFEPYFTTKDQGKGNGMGLAVVHGIVKTHGGHISVSSTPGKGTLFTVMLPAIESENYEGFAPDALAVPGGKGEHILLVDDEEEIIRFAGAILESLGYRVTTKNSSIDALDDFRLNPGQYDLVITDMTMPSMTGDQLARKILEIRPDTPIIMCTGFSELMNEAKAKSIGIRKFVMKPLVRTEIAAMVRETLDAGDQRLKAK